MLFALPALIFFMGFNAYPALNAFYLSLTDWEFSEAPNFIGVKNYIDLLDDGAFINSLSVTVYFTAVSAPLLLITGLGLALLLNKRFRFRNVYRSIFFFPVITPVVVISILWAYLYHSTYGPINSLLARIGVAPIPWLMNKYYAMPSLIIMNVWRFSGLFMLIFLSGLQDIPVEIFDSGVWWEPPS